VLLAALGSAGTRFGAPPPAGEASAPARLAAARTTAAPGPAAPTVVYSENFENGQGTVPIRLSTYQGASGETYTADQPWLQNCNGWIASFSDPPASSPLAAPQVADCDNSQLAWDNVRNLAYALGKVNGTPDPSANHGVSAYTHGANPGADHVEFATVNPIKLRAERRFLTFSVNAAEMNCFANHAQLEFYLVNGAAMLRAFTAPIDPCADGSPVSTPSASAQVYAGTYYANDAVLFSGSSLGIRMVNAQGSGVGNDHAFDDIRVMDVTPQLQKSFSPASVAAGSSATLTYTIVNTTELAAKNGWSFTDKLSTGLRLATPADPATTCAAGAVMAMAGGDSVQVAGDLNAGETSCTVTVKVTSRTPGTFSNGPTNITTETGLNPPEPAKLVVTRPGMVVTRPGITVMKSADPVTFSGRGQVIRYSFRVTNTGNAELSAVGITDTRLPGLSPIRCPETSLAPDAAQTCTATYTTTAADVAAGSITNSATVHAEPPGFTIPLVSVPSTAEAMYAAALRPVTVPVTG